MLLKVMASNSTSQTQNDNPSLSNCPAQDENYGGNKFYWGDGFSCRYILTKKGPFNNIYIPYGPNFRNLEGLKNFLRWVDQFKLSKVKIDLYRIYIDQAEALSLIKQAGFKSSKYVQDYQTSIVTNSGFQPNSRAKRYVKSALKHHTALNLIKTKDADVINQCYQIYEKSCELKGYQLKRTRDYFYQLASEGVLTIVKDNETDEINCFLLSTIRSVGDAKLNHKVLFLVFTAMTEKGRNLHLGFLATAHQFEEVFNNQLADQADFMGFSQEKGKHSIFKTKFGNEIIDLSGSFQRFKFL
jgi:hypothetical protein